MSSATPTNPTDAGQTVGGELRKAIANVVRSNEVMTCGRGKDAYIDVAATEDMQINRIIALVATHTALAVEEVRAAEADSLDFCLRWKNDPGVWEHIEKRRDHIRATLKARKGEEDAEA